MGISKLVNGKVRIVLISIVIAVFAGGGLTFFNLPYKKYIILGLALISLFLLWILVRMLYHKVQLLQVATQSLAHGELHQTKVDKTEDIFGLIFQNINTVIQKITQATDFITHIGKDSASTVQLQDDYLGRALIEMSEKMHEIQEEEKKRTWVVEGLAKFAEILRSDAHDLSELSNKVISNLVKYVGANQGGLFIEQEEESGEKYLELMAAYAYEKRKYVEKKVYVGQGLLGQALLEKEHVYHTVVPENYVQITSGLGEAPPRNLVIIPLILNEEMYGAVELASFQKLETYKMEFLHKVAENIASTVASVKVNSHTRNLLEESRNLTTELQSNEEEMRQNMEELSATQEEMQRKQAELDGVIQAIDTTLLTAEFDIDGNIIKTNDALQHFLGYDEDSMRRETYKIILGEDDNHHLWNSIIKNNGQTSDYKIQSKSGIIMWLNASFTLVMNGQNEVSKVLLLAQDVTDKQKLQLATKKQEAELKSHLDAINQTIASVAFDMQGSILDVNDIFLGVTGFTKEELVGKHYEFLLSEDEKAKPQTQMMWDNLMGGQCFSGEFKNVDKEGREIWLVGTYNPINDVEGKPYKVMMFAQFTTTEKERQKDLIGTLHAIVNSVPVLEINEKGNIKTANDIFLNLVSYRRMEVIRKELKTLLSPASQKDINMMLPQLFGGVDFIDKSIEFVTVKGEMKHFRATFTAIRNLENKVYKVIILLLDAA